MLHKNIKTLIRLKTKKGNLYLKVKFFERVINQGQSLTAIHANSSLITLQSVQRFQTRLRCCHVPTSRSLRAPTVPKYCKTPQSAHCYE